MEKVKTGGIEYLSAYMMIAITGFRKRNKTLSESGKEQY